MKKLEIINKTKERTNRSLFEKIADIVFKKRKQKSTFSLIFVNDREIKKLNRKYRKKNKVTNVLSFSALSLGKEKFIVPKDTPLYLGEVVISLPQAKRQAKLFGGSLKKELARLFIHGLLHLLGYGHKSRKERQKMEELETRVIEGIKNKRFVS